MTNDEETVEAIQGEINALPLAQQEACRELADWFGRAVRSAGIPVGPLALALTTAVFVGLLEEENEQDESGRA